MSLYFELIAPNLPQVQGRVAPPLEDLDDFSTLAIVCCGILEAVGYKFHISGFGSEDWNFDTDFDMSTLVESIPDFVDRISKSGHAVIDLYSQGVERELSFCVDGSRVSVQCISRTQWEPVPSTIVMSYTDLGKMFIRLVRGISQAVLEHAPEIAHLGPLDRWRDGRLG